MALESGTAGQGAHEADDDAANRIELGANIRSLRTDAEMTINTLAQGAGVSPSLVSQVERGVAEPSLASLRRIAKVLDVPVAALFGGGESGASDSFNRRGERLVVRADSRKLLKGPDSEMTYELMVPDVSTRKVEIVRFEFPPHSRIPDEPARHVGEESTIVVDGEIYAFHDGEQFVLGAGDTITWDSNFEHWIENRSDSPATVVSVISPPTF
ncbi:MAG TPA: XRE family transcriptional regulator [Solirubrobacterales bacterium]|nr:XRE family transcriptional regulator [Polyangia bacterium]HVW47862.1 XRE family transcriptional regulator [Solirubrobacterales bacterium]